MTEERFEENKHLIALQMMVLGKFTNEDLAGFNSALHWKGSIAPHLTCYAVALAGGIIKEDGTPAFDVDLCQYAASAEVQRRIKAGTFQ